MLPAALLGVGVVVGGYTLAKRLMVHRREKVDFLVEVAPPRVASAGKPATGPTYRNVSAKDGFAKMDGVQTLFELFSKSVEKFPNNRCLGFRFKSAEGSVQNYIYYTYSETADLIAQIASFIVKIGGQRGDRVGVYGANSPEWMMTMQACNRQSFHCVPLYDSLGENAVEYIVVHSEAKFIFTSSNKFATLAKALPAFAQQIKAIIYWGPENKKAAEEARASGVEVYSWEEAKKLGQAAPQKPDPPKPDDYCTIMYTSGTTGDPKGVLITHDSVVSTVAAVQAYLEQVTSGEKIDQSHCMLSYLPLAHIFDRTAEELFLSVGARIAYFQGDVKFLVDDIAASKPSMFIGVPRVFDRIYTGVKGKITEAGGIKAFLFNWGYARKSYQLKRGVPYKHAAPLFDKVVFSKVKERLGGNVQLIVSGGAPLAPHVEEFLKVTMCAPVVQGYGLTETCAASFIADPDNPDMMATVGPPMPCLEYRLEAVPEMNYDPNANPPRGEVCVRGPCLFKGYYKNEEMTAEVLDKEGWFHTGDVGEINAAGALKIIDRKKNIFKLSQGEYIAVEKVEAAYKKNHIVDQFWVYGNSFENFLVAVAVPNEEHLAALAKQNGITGSHQQLAADPRVNKLLLDALTETAKASHLKGFEMVKKLIVDTHEFSVEDDTMTPTFKLKRPQLLKRYKDQIDAIYKASGGGLGDIKNTGRP